MRYIKRSKMSSTRKLNPFKVAVRVFLTALLICVMAISAYVFRVFTHTREAMHTVAEYQEMFPENSIEVLADDLIRVTPADPKDTGIIFYPGATVAPEAYIPLLENLASDGYYCYIFRMPCNFALFGADKASLILDEGRFLDDLDLDITRWYIAGHSLGGAAATKYAAEHPQGLSGVIEISSTTNGDLRDKGLPLLSIFGSKDTVLTRRTYQKNLANNPKDFTEYEIPGANHAQMGDYGWQTMDSEADISAEEQRKITSDYIVNWIER